MSRARRHLAAIVIIFASLLGAAGCVNVPTTGPIERVEGQQPACQNCVNVVVAPPAPGDEPRQIVEGFLRATSNYQPNYSVAKQFLTRMAAETWSPDEGVSIYQGSVSATGETTVKLDGRFVGSLVKDRTYKALDHEMNVEYNLRQEDGEWRIENPPPGLFVTEFSFDSFYRPYDLYFLGNGSSLVPNPIYLPALSNPANVASALMKALLNGPSGWLRPAVSTAIPPHTSLSVDSVTITDGIAEVPLSDPVLDLPDPQRSLLAAQVVYTLKQVGGVKGVMIRVNQQPYRVPGSDPNSVVISVDAIPRDLDPIPLIAGQQLYAVRGRKVEQVTTTTDAPTPSPLPGALGRGEHGVDALAISLTNTDLAVITDDRTTLRRAPIATGDPRTLRSGATNLLRPQFTRYGEIWDIGRQDGRQRMWMFTADDKRDKTFEISSPVLQEKGVTVTAFKISPDGTRMALVRRTATGDELGVARIIRSDKIIFVNGWRAVTQTNTPAISAIADVAWVDATELLVLGAADAGTAYEVFRVAADASRITALGGPDNWAAVELAALPGTQSAIIAGRVGETVQTWKYNGNQWLPFVDKVRTVAYPG